MKAKPAPLRYDAPCCACAGPHDLRACADLRGAAVLRERGRLMTAVEVERRAGGVK